MHSIPVIVDLSPQVFLVSFVTGAAVLAMWIHVRFPDRGPAAVWPITLHMVLSIVTANVLVRTALRDADSDGALLAVTLGVVLPAIVYMFMSAIWLIRFGQGMLGRYSR